MPSSGGPGRPVQLSRSHGGTYIKFLTGAFGCSVAYLFLWRFAYIAFSHGGAVVLWPTILFSFALSCPLMYLELQLGRHFPPSVSLPLAYGQVAPAFKGFGYSAAILCFYNVLYNAALLTMTLVSLAAVTTQEGVIRRCDHRFATDTCHSIENDRKCMTPKWKIVPDLKPNTTQMIYYRGQCMLLLTFCKMHLNTCKDLGYQCLKTSYSYDKASKKCVNESAIWDTNDNALEFSEALVDPKEAVEFSLPAEDMFLLLLAPDLAEDDFQAPSWYLTLGSMATWVVITIFAIKEALSFKKVHFFSLITPLFMIGVSVYNSIEVAQRNSASKGASRFAIPEATGDFGLNRIHVWSAAIIQALLGTSQGTGSYLYLAADVGGRRQGYWEPMLITTFALLQWVLTGLYLFITAAEMARVTNKPLHFAGRLPELTPFAAHVYTFSQTPVVELFVAISYFLFFAMSLDNTSSLLELVFDATKSVNSIVSHHRELTLAFYGYIGFLVSLFFATPQAPMVLAVFDGVCGIGTVIVCLGETIALTWILKYDRLFPQSPSQMRTFWTKAKDLSHRIFYTFIFPLMILAALIVVIISGHYPLFLRRKLPWPYAVAQSFLLLVLIAPTIVYILWSLRDVFNKKTTLKRLFQPTSALQAALGAGNPYQNPDVVNMPNYSVNKKEDAPGEMRYVVDGRSILMTSPLERVQGTRDIVRKMRKKVATAEVSTKDSTTTTGDTKT